jgi:hypothetical protein
MKVTVSDSPIIKEIDMLKENNIQGLYPVKDCCTAFWTLKAKIELAIFQHEVSKISFQDQKEKQK